MKDIKFRALSTKDRDVPDGTFVYFEPILGCGVRVDKSTLEQFTGFYDRYGEAIYEGDILYFSYGIPSVSVYAPVEWKVDQWVVLTKGHEPEEAALGSLSNYIGEYEVVGNIRENPELLKQD